MSISKKPVRAWIDGLTDRDLASKIKEQSKLQHGKQRLRKPVRSLHRALDQAFTWRRSEQGHDFWADIFCDMKNNPDDWYTKNKFKKQKQKLKI